MRNGDFRGTAIIPTDPLTGSRSRTRSFPADRIDPSATNVMNFFYPLPNQGTLASGYGVFQQFVPETRNRQRADLRLDHEASENDSIFLRGSYQHRDPNTHHLRRRQRAHEPADPGPQAQHRLGDRRAGRRSSRPTMVNELRAGYNYDNSRRESTFNAASVASQLGLENAPSLAPDRLGFPRSSSRRAPTGRPNIADAGRNVDRTLDQNAFSISDNLTLDHGRPLR